MISIDKLDNSVSYIDWFCDYALNNKPCIFTSDTTKEWRACKQWKLDDGRPDKEFLITAFGDADVPVVDLSRSLGYDSQTQLRMKFKDLVISSFDSTEKLERSLYLKDWHFVKEFPNYKAYDVPIYLCNDWMNEYWDLKNDPVEIDYRFVYMGGNGTWTPFHADVFRSYSWSANVCGRKKWYLVQPGAEKELQSSTNDISEIIDKHPELVENGLIFEVIQDSGEIIFVPSNWHHQVHNLDSAISINHNWCNGANIHLVVGYILDRLDAVKRELLDCQGLIGSQDWFQQCQVVLKCDAGMDFLELLSMLKTIINRRLQRLRSTPRNIRISKELYHCEPCGQDVPNCKRTKTCLDHLKSILRNFCKCKNLEVHCEFCTQFFDVFDVMVAISSMKNVMATEDAKMIPDTLAWEKQILCFDHCINDFLNA